MNEVEIQKLPKVELHCHLDGSVGLELLKTLAVEQGREDLALEEIAIVGENVSLTDYLKSFDLILPLLQISSALTRAVVDVARQASLDSVKYLEIRFAPRLHLHGELTLTEVIEAVVKGALKAEEKYDLKVNLLICGMKHHTVAQNEEVLETVIALNHDSIVGFDMAGDESNFPVAIFKKWLDKIQDLDYPLTLHAGECGCAHNVIEAMSAGASRIGHGVAIVNDPEVLEKVKEQGVLLEMCPISNIQTGAVNGWNNYPIRQFLAEGVKCCINTDNRTVSNTNLTKEYLELSSRFNLSRNDFLTLNLNGIESAFMPDKLKEIYTFDFKETYLEKNSMNQ